MSELIAFDAYQDQFLPDASDLTILEQKARWQENEVYAANLAAGFVTEEQERQLIGDLMSRALLYAHDFGVSPPHTAEDLASSAMIRVHNRLRKPGYKPGSVRAYLRTAVRNQSISMWQHSCSQPELVLSGVSDEFEAVTSGAAQDTDDRYFEGDSSQASELLGGLSLDDVFDSMNHRHARVLQLIVLEGYSYQQAAEQLDVPIGTIMSSLNRARNAAKEVIASRH